MKGGGFNTGKAWLFNANQTAQAVGDPGFIQTAVWRACMDGRPGCYDMPIQTNSNFSLFPIKKPVNLFLTFLSIFSCFFYQKG